MIEIANIVIDALNPSYNLVQWEVTVPSGQNLYVHEIDVYKAETPGVSGLLEYDLVASGLAPDIYTYQDTSNAKLYSPHRIWFYKLKVRDTVTNQEQLFPDGPGAYFFSTGKEYTWRNIIKRKELPLRKFTGRNLSVLKRRTWGQHCPACWDAALFKATDPNCPICYGTGWVGGYFKPIQFLGTLNPSPKYHQILMFSSWAPSDSLLTMLQFPPLNINDVIIDDKGYRWLIIQIRTLERYGYIIEQSAQLSLIDQDEIEYKIDHTILPTSEVSSSVISVNSDKSTKAFEQTEGIWDICLDGNIQLETSDRKDHYYQWLKDGYFIPDANRWYYNTTDPGLYSVITSDLSGAKKESNNILVGIGDALEVSITTVSGITEFCEDSPSALTVTSGAAYQWYRDSIAISGATLQTYLPDQSGKYIAEVFSEQGCSSYSDSIFIDVHNKPSIVIANDPSQYGVTSDLIFDGDETLLAIILSSSDNFVSLVALSDTAIYYQWYKDNILISGAISQTYNVVASGIYKVKGTSSFGCSNFSDEVIITE